MCGGGPLDVGVGQSPLFDGLGDQARQFRATGLGVREALAERTDGAGHVRHRRGMADRLGGRRFGSLLGGPGLPEQFGPVARQHGGGQVGQSRCPSSCGGGHILHLGEFLLDGSEAAAGDTEVQDVVHQLPCSHGLRQFLGLAEGGPVRLLGLVHVEFVGPALGPRGVPLGDPKWRVERLSVLRGLPFVGEGGCGVLGYAVGCCRYGTDGRRGVGACPAEASSVFVGQFGGDRSVLERVEECGQRGELGSLAAGGLVGTMKLSHSRQDAA